MRRIIAILRSLLNGEALIDRVDKTRVSRTPGDVTEVPHN